MLRTIAWGWGILGLLFHLAPAAQASPPAPLAMLDLAALKAIALERQPAIAAARASYQAALAKKQSLDNLRVPTFLQRDLPIRRQQAELGPVAAQAGILLAERNTVFAVQYSYFTYLYARTQEQLSEETLKGLSEREEELNKILKEREKDPDADLEFRPPDRERLRAMTQLARARREEARIGSLRALSALREALGVEQNCPLILAHDRLLEVDLELTLEPLLELAYVHRPEIVQASIAVKVHELEVAAQQARKRSPSVRTFASGTDLHVQPLPAGSFDSEYRPQAVGPEMPSLLAGQTCDRVNIASIYQDRSQSVVAKARSLIRLEVEQAFLRYQEAHAKLPELEKGIDHATRAAQGLRESVSESLNRARARSESFINSALIGSQLRIQANEARYHLLVSLAALERATGGAFCAGLDTAPQIRVRLAEPMPEKDNEKAKEDDKKDL